jgi:dCTP deaminase
LLLADHQIRELCLTHGMVVPYNEELLNPASLDVTLGTTLLVEVEHTPELQILHIDKYTKEKPFWLAPQEFVLAETVEVFHLPDDVCAQFILKSSRGREGISHALCGYCDAGWHGSRLTLELHSLRSMHSIPLYPGLKIGQLVFYRMDEAPERTYAVTGRYNLDTKVTASKG